MSQIAGTNGNEGVGAKRGLWPLEALNFFMADMQAGIGPFLGVFLLAHHWESGLIGTVMTIGGVAGMIMTAPAGALIDATPRKRALRHHPRNLHGSGFGDRLALAGFLAGGRLADRDGHRRRSNWPGGRRHHAWHGATGGLQPPERPQPGV